MATTPPTVFKARLEDLGLPAPGSPPVYVAERPCKDCAPSQVARLIDFLSTPAAPQPFYPVYGVVTECQKNWHSQPQYVDHPVGGGQTVRLSREIDVQLNAAENCTDYAEPCPRFTLLYDYVEQRWEGSYSFNGGTATVAFWGTLEAGEIVWRVLLGGCAYSGDGTPGIAGTDCDHPWRWTATGISAFSGCCDSPPEQPAPMFLEAKITPYKAARLVEGAQVGGRAVYAAGECCPQSCQESPGCCRQVPSSEWGDLVWTVFDVVNYTEGCACAGPVVTPHASEPSCRIISFDNCPGPNTYCLSCDLAAAQYAQTASWEHYRLNSVHEPSEGSCDPFYVTFENLPWTSTGPYGTCQGTMSVTITR